MIERPPSIWHSKVETRALRPPVEPNGNPDVAPSSVGEDVDEPGDPMGVEILGDPAPFMSTQILASPWSGWPAEWATPLFNGGRHAELVDAAWSAIDLNSSVLAAMPPYLVKNGEVLEPRTWMTNPDPDLYTCWDEFARELWWDFHHGEAFVLPTAYSDGWPARFHVVRPWMVNAEMVGGRRRYSIGSIDVTDEILHIRYKSTTDDARGHGPLEAGSTRLIAAGLLIRYAAELARGGGVPYYVLTSERRLTAKQTDDLLHQWWTARTQHLGLPAVLSGGVGIEQMQMSPKDMALVELAQLNEARIVQMVGVPPFLVGLPAGGDSYTYKNAEGIYDFHWRAYLRPRARLVMGALSEWVVPRGTTIELNRDEYVRPGLPERATAWATLHGIVDDDGTRAINAAEVRQAERFDGAQAVAVMNGGK